MGGKGMGMAIVQGAGGRVAGIFTDGDLRRAVERGVDFRATRVDSVMTREPRAIGPERLAIECVERMESLPRVMQLLVVDADGPAGRRAAHARPLPGAGAVSATLPEELAARARRIRLVTLDVDGVLTDGRIYVDDHGHEFKAYSALDGQGMKMLQRAGIEVAWITGSNAPSVRHRAQHLGIAHVVLGAERKQPSWEKLRAQLDMPAGGVRARRRRPARRPAARGVRLRGDGAGRAGEREAPRALRDHAPGRAGSGARGRRADPRRAGPARRGRGRARLAARGAVMELGRRRTLDRAVGWMPVLLLAGLAALTWWLDAQVQDGGQRVDGSTRHDPDMFAQGVQGVELDEQGRAVQRLAARSARATIPTTAPSSSTIRAFA